MTCSDRRQDGCVYEDALLVARVRTLLFELARSRGHWRGHAVSVALVHWKVGALHACRLEALQHRGARLDKSRKLAALVAGIKSAWRRWQLNRRAALFVKGRLLRSWRLSACTRQLAADKGGLRRRGQLKLLRIREVMCMPGHL